MATRDLAIVGAGPAGLAASTYAGLRGIATVTFEAQRVGGQLVGLYPSKPVTNFPAYDEVSSGELARRLADQAAHFGAELREEATVLDVAVEDGRFVITGAGWREEARGLVLALGLGRFTPRRLGLADEERFEGRGVAYRLPRGIDLDARRIVVVGGGDSAVDAALSLAAGAEVTLVHRRQSPSAYAHSRERLAGARLAVLGRAEVVGLLGGDRLEAVVVAEAGGRRFEVPADLLLVSIGQVPDLEGIRAWRLGLSAEQIVVDSAMQTTIPGVFAVGDFASYPGKVRMIATAVAEGSTAAAAAERYLMTAA